MELLCVLAAVAALVLRLRGADAEMPRPGIRRTTDGIVRHRRGADTGRNGGRSLPPPRGCCIFSVWRAASGSRRPAGSTGAAQRLFTPGSVLFLGHGAGVHGLLFVRQPMATDFDELSLWATAVKITKVNDSLYATAELGTPWAATQNPGLPLLAYFFQFFGDYADWKIYIGYDILYFSVFAAVVGLSRGKNGAWPCRWPPCCGACRSSSRTTTTRST